MNDLLKKLNPEQLEAVTHKSGPLLIIAGAGTGKTTVIAHRIAWLIQQKLAKPSEILALTFTDKAAIEMDGRILELLPYGVLDFTAATFHSFCQDVLKDYGILGGISPDFQLLTQSQQVLFLRQNLDQFDLNIYKPISNPNRFLGAMVKLFSRAKDENVSCDDYHKLAKSYKLKVHPVVKSKISTIGAKSCPDNLDLAETALAISEQANAYTTYERTMTQYSYFDFGDLITKTLRLLNNRSTVLSQLQNQYRYIFVDEFQDTNYTQAQIVYKLAGKFQNICVVGDDDQSIYKFRGASISNIMEFLKYHPDAKKVVLKQNYRSTRQILDASYKLIKNNNPNRLEVKEKINKKLCSQKNGPNPEFWHFSDGFSEIEEIIKHITDSCSKDNKKLGDFAILVRANSHAEDFITVLKDNGIPYQFVGSRGLYDREEIKELISYLKVLSNPDDNLALFYLANSPQYKIDKILLRRLTNYSKQKNISLFEILDSIDKLGFPVANIESKQSIKKIISMLKNHLEVSRGWSTSKILIDYLYKSGLYHRLKDPQSYQVLESLENIRLFFQKISEFEKTTNDKTVFGFSEYLDLIIEAGDNPQVHQADRYEDAVNLMTIHAAKGLEFETVFMPYLVHDRFPSRRKTDPIELPEEFIKEKLPSGNIHLQEERRLFYVGLTRAKNHLYLSASDTYLDNKRPKKISQFVAETISKKYERDMTKMRNQQFLDQKDSSQKSDWVRKKEIIKLSPSALETFADCPKRFEFSYIFKIKTPQTQSLSFGNSIHNTLRDCYRLIMSGKKMTSSQIQEIYQSKWEDEGYTSKKSIKDAFKKGLGCVKNILQFEKEIPYQIEYKFNYKISKYCQISGRIDKIIKDSDQLEIIDYKTGDYQKKEKGDVSKNLPLWIYALAIKEKKQSAKIILTLHFVMGNKKISVEITPKKLAEKSQKICQIYQRISQSISNHDFPATPSSFKCQYCAYKSICPYKDKSI